MRVFVLMLAVCFTFASTDNDTIFTRLATKTPYRFVANENTTLPSNLANCAKKIWMIVRHGTRNPSDDDIRYMVDELPKIRDRIVQESERLTKDEIELFNRWKPCVTDTSVEQFLTTEGEVENFKMARRMQERYPQILPPVFDNATYRIRYTHEQRTHESAKYFAMGLFGNNSLSDVYLPEATKEEMLILRFYKYCQKWKKDIDDNPDAWIQQTSFEQSDVMKSTVANISQKLGLIDPLSIDDVLMLYKTCAYETAWFKNLTTPWCIPFDVDTIKVLEYNEDLEYYWIDGYGHELTYKQACITFKDMIDFFERSFNRTATLYFTHSGALTKFMTHLGLYKEDKPLVYTDYGTNDGRIWRVSKIGSFATNIAMILHDCGDSKKVSVLHNEQVVRLPACPNHDLCSLDSIKTYYQESINDCDFDKMCENGSTSMIIDSNLFYFVVFGYVILTYARKE